MPITSTIKISQLNPLTGSALTLDDFIPIVDSGSLVTKRSPLSSVQSLLMIATSSYASASISSSYALTSSYLIGSGQWLQSGSRLYYNNGFVGIGTSSPSSSLDIVSSSVGGVLRLGSGDDVNFSNGIKQLVFGLVNDNFVTYQNYIISRHGSSAANNAIDFYTNGNVQGLTIRNGQIGIGTTTPSASVHSVGNILTTGYIINSNVNPANSNVIGVGAAGGGGNVGYNSNFIGYQAGYSSSGNQYSNFIGYQAGYSSSNISYPIFIGVGAGSGSSINAGTQSDMIGIGRVAGYNATGNANYSTFIGLQSGQNSKNLQDCISIGTISTNGAIVTVNHGPSVAIGRAAAQALTGSADSSIFIGAYSGYSGSNLTNINAIGYWSGYNSSNNSATNFFGYQAGIYSTNASTTNMMGNYAGQYSSGSQNSNFIGNNAGSYGTSSQYCNFIGNNAGYGVKSGSNSCNFIGNSAGLYSIASYSTFIGWGAGQQSNINNNGNASYSIFIGKSAGRYASNASNCIFIGNASEAYMGSPDQADAGADRPVNNNFNVGDGSSGSSILIGNYTRTGGYPNSIAIGKGTMNFATGSLNIGNAIYATNIYSGSTPSSASIAASYVGIGTNTPSQKLHVVGTITSSGLITPVSSSSVPTLTGSMFYSSSKLFIYTGTGTAGGLTGWQTASLGG